MLSHLVIKKSELLCGYVFMPLIACKIFLDFLSKSMSLLMMFTREDKISLKSSGLKLIVSVIGILIVLLLFKFFSS